MATEHDAHVSESLPWYINGTLPTRERAEVERHLRSCRRCRDEYDWLQQLRRNVQESMPPASGDLGLSRFLDRIASESNIVPLRHPARPRWVVPAFALAASLLIAQAVVIGVLLHDRSVTLHTLSGPSTARGTLLQVTFVPQATEEQIRTAVVAAGAEIVSGPGALGVYTLSVDPDRAEAAVRTLQQAHEVVASVSRGSQ